MLQSPACRSPSGSSDARPIGTPRGRRGRCRVAVLLALLSTPDPFRLETALVSALLASFRADRAAVLGDEVTSEFRARLAKEARSRAEALAAEGVGHALCATLAGGAIVVERGDAFSTARTGACSRRWTPIVSAALRNARLFEKSTTDSLTALPNRQRFVAELEAAFGAEGPLTLILIDVDHFKDKNDVYGPRGRGPFAGGAGRPACATSRLLSSSRSGRRRVRRSSAGRRRPRPGLRRGSPEVDRRPRLRTRCTRGSI